MDALTREYIAQKARYERMPDMPGTGPYPAIMTTDPAFPGFVVYRPARLDTRETGKLALLAWGNGACSADGASARLELETIASYGYLVLAPGSIRSGPGVPPRRAEPPPKAGPLPAETDQQILVSAIDLAFAATVEDGAYHGRIDTTRIAVAGHSCGGLQALTAAADPRVKTVIIQNSGIFPEGVNPIRDISLPKSALGAIHSPILYLLGGPRDIAYPNGMDDVRRIDHIPVMAANLDVGHFGTFAQPDGGAMAKVAVDWLQWRLRDDPAAAAMFVGPSCGLCRDTAWQIERKQFP